MSAQRCSAGCDVIALEQKQNTRGKPKHNFLMKSLGQQAKLVGATCSVPSQWPACNERSLQHEEQNTVQTMRVAHELPFSSASTHMIQLRKRGSNFRPGLERVAMIYA